MDRHEATFARIESALKTLDTRADAAIRRMDERLQALGVTVETYLAEPVDAWRTTDPAREITLFLGYARHAGRWGLALRTVRRLPQEAPGAAETVDVRVEPLRDVERWARIAVVDKLADVLAALEAELERRSARIGEGAPASAPVPARAPVVAQAAREPVAAAAPLPAVPAPKGPTGEVKKAEVLMAAKPQPAHVDGPLRANDSPESVDHMFRLFGRKGR